MHSNNFISNFDPTLINSTSHSIGEKFVFFSNDQLEVSPLTQIALGMLKAGDIIPFHSHGSMEEIFFILTGSGFFYIENEKFNVFQNCCIRVPAGILHSIKANCDMSFFYFGVAIN